MRKFLALLIAPALGACVNVGYHQPAMPVETIVMIDLDGSHGSGVVIDAEKGIVVTARHVIEDEKKITVVLPGGAKVEAQVIAVSSEASDYAVLQIDPTVEKLHAAKVRTSAPVVGEPLTIIGFPMKLGLSVSFGRVSSAVTAAPMKEKNLIQMDATVAPGNSGGGVFDAEGRLIGLAEGIALSSAGMLSVFTGFSFATPMSDVCATWECGA